MVRYENAYALALYSCIIVEASSHSLDCLLSEEQCMYERVAPGVGSLSRFRAPPCLSELRGFPAIWLMVLRLINRNLFLGPLFDIYKLPGERSDLDGVFGGVLQTIRRVDVDL